METLEIIYDPLPSEALGRFISENVIGLNFALSGDATWHPVNFFLRNGRGEWLGGLTGHVWGRWLQVSFLWVSEPLRGRGLGTRLMDAAEDFARERGSVNATLETLTFQAPDFYKKPGYVEFGRLEDFPSRHAKRCLRKSLKR